MSILAGITHHRQCRHCWRTFDPIRSDQVYCTQKCGADHRRSFRLAANPKRTETRTCATCRNGFQAKVNSVKKYCGDSCKHYAATIKRRAKRNALSCRRRMCECGCGEEFRPGVKTRFATEACAHRQARRDWYSKIKMANLAKKECPTCHKPFFTTRRNKVYCKKDCR